jgi:hypothetical protein
VKITLDLTPEEKAVLFSEGAQYRVRKYVWDAVDEELHEYGEDSGGHVATFHVYGVPGDVEIVAALYNAFRRELLED